MKVQIATPELVVLETAAGEKDEQISQTLIRTALKENGIEQWSSIEIEDYTYRNSRLIFAKPVKVYIPGFLMRLTD